jgi:exosortase
VIGILNSTVQGATYRSLAIRLPLTRLSQLGLALATTWVLWPVFQHAVVVWSTSEEFSFGFLVPPVAALLVWWRRATLQQTARHGSALGLAIAFGALVLYVFAERVEIHALAGLAVAPLLLGMALYLWGWGTARSLAFPVSFLTGSLTLHRGLLSTVGFALQEFTALAAAPLARGFGVPVERSGLVLRSDQFAFIVAEECSGMSALVAMLALALLWVAIAQGPLPARLVVLLSVLPLVALANTLRVALVLLVAAWFGPEAALGFFHGASGLLLFAMIIGALGLVSWRIGCRIPPHAM